MQAQRATGRELKKTLAELLLGEPFAAALERIEQLDARRVVSPLFGLFCSRHQLQRWRAVTAMGAVVARLAGGNMESARVVMRRFMWNLNEESGGIGWGCPEAMGECMARSRPLAEEYAGILVSYLHPERNFLEHPGLQQGVLWGIGRLAHGGSATLAGECAELLPALLDSPEAAVRGHAAWAGGFIAAEGLARRLEALVADRAPFDLYDEERLTTLTVGTAAERALQTLQMSLRKG